MKLVHISNGREVKVNDRVKTFRGEKGTLTGIEKPKHGGSTGRIHVVLDGEPFANAWYPSVCNMHWIDREDQ